MSTCKQLSGTTPEELLQRVVCGKGPMKYRRPPTEFVISAENVSVLTVTC